MDPISANQHKTYLTDEGEERNWTRDICIAAHTRGIIEEIMLDLMYSLPSQTKIKNCNVTKKMVDEITGGKVVPLLSNEKRIVKESA